MRPMTQLATIVTIVVTLIGLTLMSTPAVAAAPLSVGGTVLTADGSALADATVELRPLLSNYQRARRTLAGLAMAEPVTTTTTDPTGRFVLEPPDAGVWRVVVRRSGFVPMRFALLPLVRSTELPAVTLLPDAGSRIEVRQPSGEPAVHVQMFAQTASDSLWEVAAADGWQPEARIARSDEDGRLAVARAPDERLTIHLFSPLSTGVHRSEAGEKATVVLRGPTGPEQPIEVLDERGSPVPDVVVAAGDLVWAVGTTGEDGRLTLGWDASAPVKLHLFAADGRRQTEEVRPAHDRPVRFVLTPQRRMAGRIIASAGRRPVPRALVWPFHDPGTFVLSDAQGGYELMAPPGDHFSVRIEAAGFLSRNVTIRRGAENAGYGGAGRAPTVALTAAAPLAGQVVDGGGAPLDAALVEAANLAHAQDGIDQRALSGPGGRFTLVDLDPSASYELTATADGFVPAAIRISPKRETVRIVLHRSRPGYGRVIDGDERPLAGVEITVMGPAAAVTARSGEDGRFELTALPGSKVDLHARKKGYSPLTVRGVELPSGEGPVDLGTLVLVPGVVVTGRVLDAEEKPIAGAEVRITPAQGRPRRQQADRIRREKPAAVAGADGRFAIEDLNSGEILHLLVTAAGYLPAWSAGVEAPNRELLMVVLEPAFALSGRVVDEDGGPIAGARIQVSGQGPSPGTVGVDVRELEVAKSGVTDGDGTFVIAELPPARVAVEVDAAGFQASAPRELEIPSAAAADVRFVLKRGAVVEGRVTSSDGEPVAGARVRVVEAAAISDGEGIYRLEGVPLGRRALIASHLEYQRQVRMIEVEPGLNHADVILVGGWPVTGRVIEDDGTPVEGARVELVLDGTGELRRYQEVSADGVVSFPRVVDGTFDVFADKDGYGAVEIEQGLRVAGGPVTDFEIVLRPAAVLTGRLLGLEFEELATAAVEAELSERTRRIGTVDYDGGYEIRDLGPGVWLIKARVRDGSREAQARILIEPGIEEMEKDLEFGRGITVRGRISFRGLPLPETSVTFLGHDTAVRRTVMTDHQGAFRVANLEPGRYRLGLANHREHLLYNEDIELLGDRELNVDIPTAWVSGRVISATTSQPLSDALVFIQRLLDDDTEPGSLVTVPTDGEGTFTLGRLSAGRYSLSVRLDGYAPAERMLEVEAGVVIEDLELAVSPTEGLDVMLRLAAGGVPNPATVAVLDPSGSLVLRETRTLAPDGHGRYPTVPPGSWELVISAPGAAVTRTMATVPGPPVVLTLTAGTRLRVRIPELVESGGVARLTLVGQDGRAFLGVDHTGLPQTEWPISGGTGIVDGVPEGFWTVRAVAPGGRSLLGSVATAGGGEVEVVLE